MLRCPACLLAPGVILMTCAAILPWLSYGEKDHVTFLFFGKNVSPSSWGITSSSEDDASCSPPLLNHCSIVPYEHLKKKNQIYNLLGAETCSHGFSKERTGGTAICSTFIASDCIQLESCGGEMLHMRKSFA